MRVLAMRNVGQRPAAGISHATIIGPGPATIPAHCSKGLFFGDSELRSYSRSEEHTSELQSRGHLVCRLLLEKKKNDKNAAPPHKSRPKKQAYYITFCSTQHRGP